MAFSFTSIGWLAVAFSINTAMIFLGRVVHGIGEGMLTVVTVIYISEFIQEKHRGGTLSSLIIGCLLGLVLYYVCFALISWRIAAGVFTAMNIIHLLCSYAIEESPPWRLFKEKDMKDNAKNDKDIEDVFTKKEKSKHSETDLSIIRFISTSIAPLLLLLAPITGGSSIGFFVISMVEKMHMKNPVSVAIAVGMMRVMGAACGRAFIQRFGRRIPLIFSSASTFLSLGVISLLLVLDILPSLMYNYIMVTLLVLVMFCTSLGMASVPFIILGEWPQVRVKVFLSVCNFPGNCRDCWSFLLLHLCLPGFHVARLS